MNSTDREIVTSRTFAAPRSLVWKVWTEPAHVGNWWGPNGFTTTTSHIDVRPGGVWTFVMHGPDGRDYDNTITYIEVVEPERLVYAHGGGDGDLADVSFHVTVTFVERDGQTELMMRSVFPTAEERDRVAREYGAVEGAVQHLGRLAEYLANCT